MNPGNLQDRITLVYPSSASIDRYGQSIMNNESASVWANVKMLNGNESTVGGLTISSATYQFIMRKRSQITEKSTLIYNGNSYNVVFVDEPFAGYYKVTAERRN
jgi:SPP1 family predicted phage head-tail adaptor